jgi:8-oxo-dGTP pyrophosphatase MutT (NUDIX family)
MTEAIPAATLILWRETSPPSILMVKRASGMAFAADAMVFPGGRVDHADLRLVPVEADAEEMSARVAAIRETIEETGIAIGITPAPSAASIAQMRQALKEGVSLAELIDAGGYRLDLDAMHPFARWRPPHNGGEARIFDTRFYIALAPDDAAPSADGEESTHAVWAAPADILREADAGARRIIYPTRRNLERLASLGSFAQALADAARHPVRLIQPVIEHRADGDWLCIPDDVGYPVTAEPMLNMTRG